jgi:hypothetical protein
MSVPMHWLPVDGTLWTFYNKGFQYFEKCSRLSKQNKISLFS